jgi:hypothetical protein
MATPTKDTLNQKLQGYGLSQVVALIDPLSFDDLRGIQESQLQAFCRNPVIGCRSKAAIA